MGVGNGEIHRRPAHEVSAVHDDGAFLGENVFEGGHHGSRVEAAVGGELGGVFHGAEQSEIVFSDFVGVVTPSCRFVGGGNPSEEGVEEGADVGADVVVDVGVRGFGFVVDPDDLGFGSEQGAVTVLEGVERCCGDQYDVRLSGYFQGVFPGETTGDAEVPWTVDDVSGHDRSHEHCAEPVSQFLERLDSVSEYDATPCEQQWASRQAEDRCHLVQFGTAGGPRYLGGQRSNGCLFN